MQKKTQRKIRGNKKTRRTNRRISRRKYEKGGDANSCDCKWNYMTKQYDCPFWCAQHIQGSLHNAIVDPVKNAATSTGTFLGNTASTIGSTAANTATAIGSTARQGAYGAYNMAAQGANTAYETGTNVVRPVTNYFRPRPKYESFYGGKKGGAKKRLFFLRKTRRLPPQQL